jgi:hypothetical protein
MDIRLKICDSKPGEKKKRLLRRGEMELKTKGKLGKSSGEYRNSQYDYKELLLISAQSYLIIFYNQIL